MTDLRRYARGKPCMIREPGVCNGDPTTTVLAHLNGGGMGMKHSDLHGAWACSACHDWVDQRSGGPSGDRKLRLLEAIIRTQQQLIKSEIISW